MRTILVTGFGSFPGVARNPTEEIVADLARHRARLSRLGVGLACAVLPVRYDALVDALSALLETHRPDAVLHLGVASRRRLVSIETRAVNRASPLHPDASRRRPAQVLSPGSPGVVRATYPAGRIRAAIRAEGIDARLSNDAGDYVCNAILYRSLATAAGGAIGFIHVPKPRGVGVPRAWATRRRATREDLTRAVVAALIVLARGPARAGIIGSGAAFPPAGDCRSTFGDRPA